MQCRHNFNNLQCKIGISVVHNDKEPFSVLTLAEQESFRTGNFHSRFLAFDWNLPQEVEKVKCRGTLPFYLWSSQLFSTSRTCNFTCNHMSCIQNVCSCVGLMTASVQDEPSRHREKKEALLTNKHLWWPR